MAKDSTNTHNASFLYLDWFCKDVKTVGGPPLIRWNQTKGDADTTIVDIQVSRRRGRRERRGIIWRAAEYYNKSKYNSCNNNNNNY